MVLNISKVCKVAVLSNFKIPFRHVLQDRKIQITAKQPDPRQRQNLAPTKS